MRKSIGLGLLAVLITLASALWQRLSGPTVPVRGKVDIGGRTIHVELRRSHGGDSDQPVRIETADPEVTGELTFRRYRADDEWTRVAMQRDGNVLHALLPRQPPAGKLEYRVLLTRGTERRAFPPRAVIIRFKGAVAAGLLIPHILAMFVGLLLSTRAGLAALLEPDGARGLAWGAFACIVVGGLVLGPLVQKAAFGAYWTGIPFGWDLTDNKTLIVATLWGWVAWRLRGGRAARWSVVAAAIATLVVFGIPHSTWGSELRTG